MAAIRVNKNREVKATLGTTLTHVIPGDDVRAIEISCASDVLFVHDDAKADGDAISATEQHRIVANVHYPIEINGTRLLIAAASGTPAVSLRGLPE
jgi:hypothetical protein